jgi:hypothetical protein
MAKPVGSPLWLLLLAVALVAKHSCAASLTDEHAIVPETDFITSSEDNYDRYGYSHKEVSIKDDVAWETEGSTIDALSRQAGVSKYKIAKALSNEEKHGEVYQHHDGRFQPLPPHVHKAIRKKYGHSIVDEVRKQFNDPKNKHYGMEKAKKPNSAKKKKKIKKPESPEQEKWDARHWAIEKPGLGKKWVNDAHSVKPQK